MLSIILRDLIELTSEIYCFAAHKDKGGLHNTISRPAVGQGWRRRKLASSSMRPRFAAGEEIGRRRLQNAGHCQVAVQDRYRRLSALLQSKMVQRRRQLVSRKP